MLNTIVHIADDYESIYSDLQVNNNSIQSVILGGSESYKDLFSKVYNTAYYRSVKKFCISYDLSNSKITTIASNGFLESEAVLYQIIFNKNYCLKQGKPVVVFLMPAEITKEAYEFVFLLEKCLLDQGYPSIKKIFLYKGFEYGSEFAGGILVDSAHKNERAFLREYFSILETTNFYSNYIGFKNCNDLDKASIESELLNIEENFKKSFPLRYKLMLQQTSLQYKLEELEFDLDNANERIKNKDTYIEIMHSLDQANNINKFYHYEYEILPLWYKQFGHFLKVVMGKRSFRSLFSNDVKKYTE